MEDNQEISKTVGALTISEKVLMDAAKNVLLIKQTDGSITEDIVIKDHNLSVENGSISGGKNAIATGKNSFAYGVDVSAIGENSFAFGKQNIAGCYGWYYSNLDYSNDVIYLTDVQPNVTQTPIG